MQLLCLPAGQLFGYVLTGKFKSPSREWRHAYSYLAEYELFVMTEGVLYLTYDHVDYAVKSGEYLLLPPREAFRKGYRPAGSSFYWLHFTTNPGDIPSEIDRESIFTPPLGKIFRHSSDGDDSQDGTDGSSDETASGHGQERLSCHRLRRHVNQYPDRALRTALPEIYPGVLSQKPEADLSGYSGLY